MFIVWLNSNYDFVVVTFWSAFVLINAVFVQLWKTRAISALVLMCKKEVIGLLANQECKCFVFDLKVIIFFYFIFYDFQCNNSLSVSPFMSKEKKSFLPLSNKALILSWTFNASLLLLLLFSSTIISLLKSILTRKWSRKLSSDKPKKSLTIVNSLVAVVVVVYKRGPLLYIAIVCCCGWMIYCEFL